SHELRSPLNPILGWTQMLKRGNLGPEKTASAIASIERNAQLQVQLIGDLLDISRVLRGKLSLAETPIELRSVVLSALETVQTDAEAKSIEIHTALTPCFVNGDNVRLQQAVWNLLSNAVKFTPHQGQISVTLKPVTATTESTSVEDISAEDISTENVKTTDYAEITVTDTGKGISAEFLPYVFEHFRQEDYSTTRQFGGLGLGLAIVRQVIELHEGSVSVDSAGEGKGATFTMRLPLVQTAAPLATKQVEPQMNDLSGVSILIVDDNPDSLEIAAFGLELASATVSIAESGTKALRMLDQTVPDVLVSDIGMPDMDGYTLIEQIRARAPERGRNILAIALTAYASDTEAKKAVEAGFQRHLAKPAGPDELAKAIFKLLNR
ncbi:MAG: ATP-binding protein, partial [Cyanobacteria bacterium J06631_9]